MSWRVTVLLLALPCLLLCGCRSPQQPAGTNVPPLEVFAASSLTGSFEKLGVAFEASHPGVKVRCSFAGSQELRVQVEQGARCDVFASASESDLAALTKIGKVAPGQVFAHGRLCLVTYPGQAKVTSLADLAKPGVRLVVATETAPIGRYTRKCWDKMKQAPAYGQAFVDKMQANVASEETNVKLVLAKVELGEADAGFVYVSDAHGRKVKTITLPNEVQVQATYVIGAGNGTPNQKLAAEFVAWAVGEQGQTILRQYGLDPAGAAAPTPTKGGK